MQLQAKKSFGRHFLGDIEAHGWKFWLSAILLVTAALWCGVIGIGLNSDDYQFLAALAPIRSLTDVLRPFFQYDATPSYFRPLASATIALDFLLFHWNGAGYHLTSLLFHLTATLLVFYVVRDVFRMRVAESLIASLLFGIAASHDANLAVDADRADILVTIFVLGMLLAERYARHQPKPILARCVAVFLFALALCSKEIAIAAVPLVPLLFWKRVEGSRIEGWGKAVRDEALRVAPFVAVAILFFIYHAHFTQRPLAESILGLDASHPVLALLRNAAYSVGYLVLPLDLSDATELLARYRWAVPIAGALMAIVASGILILGVANRTAREAMRVSIRPLLFTILTGSVLLLEFQRWRIYLPSVGAIAVLVLLIARMRAWMSDHPRRSIRILFYAVAICIVGFHIDRALIAQAEWREGTALRDRLKQSLTPILSNITKRPVTLGILVSPSKLGSASVIQLGQEALVTRAEADRISSRNRNEATTDGANVDEWTAIEVYALNPTAGFHGLTIEREEPARFRVRTSPGSQLILYPSGDADDGRTRRDRIFREGDSLRTSAYIDIIRSVSHGLPTEIEVVVTDSAAVVISFDGHSAFHRVSAMGVTKAQP